MIKEVLAPNHSVKSIPVFPSWMYKGPKGVSPHGHLALGTQGLLRNSTDYGSPIPLELQGQAPQQRHVAGSLQQGQTPASGSCFHTRVPCHAWSLPELQPCHIITLPCPAIDLTELGPPTGPLPSLTSGRCPRPRAGPRAPQLILLPGWVSKASSGCQTLPWHPCHGEALLPRAILAPWHPEPQCSQTRNSLGSVLVCF